MAFVKLDCKILLSSVWSDKDARDIFITALLLAVPHELQEEAPQIETDGFHPTGFIVPPGWYGFIHGASLGIIDRCGIGLDAGMAALDRCCKPDPRSSSMEHEGRRMARIEGGFIVLNYDRYRLKDHTAAERSKRHRERMKELNSSHPSRVASRCEPVSSHKQKEKDSFMSGVKKKHDTSLDLGGDTADKLSDDSPIYGIEAWTDEVLDQLAKNGVPPDQIAQARTYRLKREKRMMDSTPQT